MNNEITCLTPRMTLLRKTVYPGTLCLSRRVQDKPDTLHSLVGAPDVFDNFFTLHSTTLSQLVISGMRDSSLSFASFPLTYNNTHWYVRHRRSVMTQDRSRAEVKAPGIIPRKSVHEPVQVRSPSWGEGGML